MQLLFLGTSSGVPTRQRNVSALALTFDQAAEWWLLDCGEGTQHQLLRTNLSPSKLSVVLISHMHGDHVFGLMGLLATRGMNGSDIPLTIVGPVGIKGFIQSSLRATGSSLRYAHEIIEIPRGSEPVVAYEDERHVVHAVSVKHVGHTLAYVLIERDKQGHFLVERAQQLGIKPGPIYAKLKNGETVTLEDGTTVDGRDLVGPTRRGRIVGLICDTSDASPALPLLRDADLIVHEATYLACAHAELAPERGHSTAADAGRFARRANAHTLVLNHFSPRYLMRTPKNLKTDDGEHIHTISELVAEAEGQFVKGRVYAAKDFMEVAVPDPEDVQGRD